MSARAVKEEKVEAILQLLGGYPTLAVAKLEKVRAAQLQELRKRFRGTMAVRVLKNRLMVKALVKAGIGDVGKLSENLMGQNIFLFTKENPFKVSLLLERSKVKTLAKGGDIASDDVVVPAGNTGLPPGPVISEFTDIGLPTRIEAGSVWISSDTVVAEKGTAISPKVAGVLSRLGIKPVEAGLELKAAYVEGLFLKGEELRLDLEAVKDQFAKAYGDALNLALSTFYITPQTLPYLLRKAHGEALNLTVQSAYPSPTTVGYVIAQAQVQAVNLASRLYGKPEAPQPEPEKRKVEKEEVKKEEEEKKVEEVGLGALFG